MDTMNVKFSTNEIMNNVSNSAYWEAIDHLAETYIKKLAKCSVTEVNLYGSCCTEEDVEDMNAKERKSAIEKGVTEVGRKVTEFAVKLLEEQYGANFPLSLITKLMREEF
jgi:hypothetical protein